MSSSEISTLISALEDEDHRLRAIEKLEASGARAKSAIPNLWNIMRNRDRQLPVNERIGALRAIGAIDRKNPDLAGNLLELIKNFEEELPVRLEAVELIEGLGTPAKKVYGDLVNFVNGYPLGEELNRALTKAVIQIHGNKAELFAQIMGALYRLNRVCWAELSILSELEMSNTQVEKALEALWAYMRKVKEVNIIPYVFQTILDISGANDEVLNQLWGDKKIPLANKILITSHSFFLNNLVVNFEKSKTEMLSIIVKALYNNEEWIRNGALKLLLKLQSEKLLSKDDFDELIDAVRNCLNTHNQGLALVFIYHKDESEGRDWLEQHPNAESAIGLFFFWDETGTSLLNEYWTAKNNRNQRTLFYVFQALEDLDDPTKVVDWLRTKIAGINLNECDQIEDRLKKFHDEYKDDLNSSVKFQIQNIFELIKHRRESLDLENLIKDIRDSRLQEDELTEKIELLTGTGSGVELRELISIWINWIKNKEKSTVIETTAELMRYNPAAVLPLVDKMNELAQERESGTSQNWDLGIYQRVVKQISLMSDERFYNDKEKKKVYSQNREELEKYALSVLVRYLPNETDIEVREGMARALGNLGGREAMNALVRALVDEEKKRQARQKLLAEYYLEPSKKYGEQTAQILKDAVEDAKKTLRILQNLNIAVFIVGVIVLIMGIFESLYSQGTSFPIAGALTGLGGLAGVVIQLIRHPLDRIQNAMANLVQLETAFTSFIWELNLNSTFIQSQYVAKGILTDDDIAKTVNRIESAMSLAMNLVAVYTEEGQQRIVTRINALSPAAGDKGITVTIYGQHLQGDGTEKKDKAGIIAINHTPVQADDVIWKIDTVKFNLPQKIPGLDGNNGTVWISLLIDGMETNALPFNVVGG